MKNVKKLDIIISSVLGIIIISLFIFSAAVSINFNKQDFAGNYAFMKAKVDSITYDDVNELKKNPNLKVAKQEFIVTVTDGSHKGERYKIRNTVEAVDVHKMLVSGGDNILVNYTVDNNGKVNTMHLYEIVREQYIYGMVAFFALSLIVICGKKGLKAIITLVFTGFMIIKVLMPIIMVGYNPLAATVIISIATVITCMYFINGSDIKTIVAAAGTLGGLLVAAIAAVITGNLCKVTGLTGNDAQMLAYTGKSITLDFKYILFSAILIGALGAVMDVGISIASAMKELMDIKPDIDKKELIKSGMNIGKDVMATMANTLILAYMGSAFSMFLLLIAERVSYTEIINLEIVTTDIITAIAGSIGIVWTVPMTVFAMVGLRKTKLFPGK